MYRHSRIALICLALAAPVAGARSSQTVAYEIDLPPNLVISYAVNIEVREPGRMVVDAEWSASRMLTLRLEQPDGTAVRRTGPSPLKLEVDVEPEALEVDGKWTLSVRGLPSRHSSSGTVRLSLPDPDAVPSEASSDLVPVPAETRAPEPWERLRPLPTGATEFDSRLFGATESFRQTVVDPEIPTPDNCQWQSNFLRYLAATRDRFSVSGSPPAVATRRMLERMSGAVAQVESFRTSDDPLLDPPPSSNRMQYRAWQVVFHRETAPVRDELDDLLHDIQRYDAGDLDSEEWPTRFVSCLIACERHFEARRSRRDMAANRKLAEDQWQRMLVAGDALGSFASVGPPLD